MSKTNIKDKVEATVEEKLKALFLLQMVDSKIDKIHTVRGELPLEVRDLEDTIVGLETRVNNLAEELQALETNVTERKVTIKDAQALIKKYESQQDKVRNNREYDAITKELEFQNLEIQLAEKRIKENSYSLLTKSEVLDTAKVELDERKSQLAAKQKELDEIVSETQKEEDALRKDSDRASTIIEDRLLGAYKRVRSNSKNGLAVVAVERDACGGCFNKIPPQRQLDIRTNKKIIVCEHCGRILVDPMITPQS
jgi:uncharacterized protein